MLGSLIAYIREKQGLSKTVVADATKITNHDIQIHLTDAKKINPAVEVDGTVQITEKIGWDFDGTEVTAFTTNYDDDFTKTSADAQRKHVIGDPGDLVLRATSAPEGSTVSVPNWEQVLDVGEEMTYTIVMWIPETGAEQNADQGKAFAAAVNFTTEGNGTGVTGVLSTTSAAE